MIDEKKKLSDWLVASDIDGTLNNKARKLPKRNYDAIQKYVYEYGGNFILSSGRSVESMRKHFKNLNLNTGYAVFINGAGVYDYSEEKIIWLSAVNEELTKILSDAAKKFKGASVQVITPDAAYLCKPEIGAWFLALSSKLPRKYVKSFDDIPKGNWCKVVFTGMPWIVKKIHAYVAERSGDTDNLMMSSPFSFETVNAGTNKGVAVLKVAEILGIDKSKTAAIGDYFNDYQMLKSVGLPACCGQAPDEMKKIAKLVTCHCNHGAVADLVEYIIANHDNL
ncbi:MAG: Cof-type HAD-IIB family hydrolase [Faecalibacterium sp.]|nr:Cof-type HAD-IIB family hydrolase [Ruminococcus sp.]MCM1391755.1 Cof-type HAD-IIB family hydrolase [Ruminococcus sp.]MCM1485035.1 Cof-type HAD-IIB family hydrolase [Faecalibacterium sp.]